MDTRNDKNLSTHRQEVTGFAPERSVRALFFSSIFLTPATGGGNTTLNVLEPPPPGSEVFYATPAYHPTNMPPPAELSSRMRMFGHSDIARRLLAALGQGRVRRGLRYIKDRFHLQNLVGRVFTEIATRQATGGNKEGDDKVKQLLGYIEELRPDVLLISPEWAPDLIVGLEVLEKTKLPMVLWFMDSYYLDKKSIPYAKRLWNMTQHRFVISETMQEELSELFGGECQVMNNCVDFSETYPEPKPRTDGRLRLAYAGGLTPYYLGCLRDVFRDLRGIADKVTFDVYSPFELPLELENITDVSWRHHPPIKPDKMVERLQEYDALLLPSSFDPKFEVLARNGHSTKVADYLASGRCIIAFGPEYADNVRYVQRHGLGETVTSREPGEFRKIVLSLADKPERARKLGEKAYHFGREHRDRAKNRDRLWRALHEAATSRSSG